jgi:hypothetical protein
VSDFLLQDRFMVNHRWSLLRPMFEILSGINQRQIGYAAEMGRFSFEKKMQMVFRSGIVVQLPRPIRIFEGEGKTAMLELQTDSSSLAFDLAMIDCASHSRIGGLHFTEWPHFQMCDQTGSSVGSFHVSESQPGVFHCRKMYGGYSRGTLVCRYGGVEVDLCRDSTRQIDRRLALGAALVLLTANIVYDPEWTP